MYLYMYTCVLCILCICICICILCICVCILCICVCILCIYMFSRFVIYRASNRKPSAPSLGRSRSFGEICYGSGLFRPPVVRPLRRRIMLQMLSGPETGQRKRVTRKADGKLTLLMNVGGSWHEKLTLSVTHFSLPVSAYPFQGHRDVSEVSVAAQSRPCPHSGSKGSRVGWGPPPAAAKDAANRREGSRESPME